MASKQDLDLDLLASPDLNDESNEDRNTLLQELDEEHALSNNDIALPIGDIVRDEGIPELPSHEDFIYMLLPVKVCLTMLHKNLQHEHNLLVLPSIKI